MFQETAIEEQMVECGLRGSVTCMEPTPDGLWVSWANGLCLYRAPVTSSVCFFLSDTINALASISATVYAATRRNWGLYQISPTLGITPIKPPEVATAESMEPRALAVWNNTLAVASTAGLYRYALSRHEWELIDREVFQYLLATSTRLWACGRELVGFDRQYRVVERAPVPIPMPPVLEQSRLWWASASGGTIHLHSYSLGTGRAQRTDFRLDDAALRAGGAGQATALVRWGAFWYVGLGGRGRGMVLRLNNAARRAELVALSAAVNILTVWQGDLMIGTRNGLYKLAKVR